MALGTKDGFMGVWERCLEELDLPKETKRSSPTKVDWTRRFTKLFRGQKWFEIWYYYLADARLQLIYV